MSRQVNERVSKSEVYNYVVDINVRRSCVGVVSGRVSEWVSERVSRQVNERVSKSEVYYNVVDINVRRSCVGVGGTVMSM